MLLYFCRHSFCMNLIVDVGNTFIKLAVFSKNELVHRVVCKNQEFSEVLFEVSREFSEIKHCIVSYVGQFSEAYIKLLKDNYILVALTNKTLVPFINDYSTPLTLGVDRIALASAAAVKFPQKNVLVIDAGSCITYDFLSDKNHYKGGAISPGIAMRYKAMNQFTAGLPLLEKEMPDFFIGDNTNASMHSGVVYGVISEIEGTINRYKNKYPDLTIILTGGDTDFLRESIKIGIFANSNFLLEGLHFILEHNKH